MKNFKKSKVFFSLKVLLLTFIFMAGLVLNLVSCCASGIYDGEIEDDGIVYGIIKDKSVAVVVGHNLKSQSNPEDIFIKDRVIYCDEVYHVTAIGKNAFKQFTQLRSIIIPPSVVSIDEGAFAYCRNLEFVNVQGSVTEIGMEAFKSCIKLYSADNIIKDAISIGVTAFYNCRFDSVTITPSTRKIGNSAFAYSSLKKVTFFYGVQHIGKCAFSCCPIARVDIPNSVTFIGAGAFSHCNSLFYVRMSNSVESIENSVFKACVNLKCVYLPNGVKAINDRAFLYCDELRLITIPQSIELICEEAFKGCKKLKIMYGDLFSRNKIVCNPIFYHQSEGKCVK